MSRRYKILLVLIGLTAPLVILLDALLHSTALTAFSEIEHDNIHRDIGRVRQVIQDEIQDLSRELLVWSSRDDTYSFASSHDLGFIEKNITPDVLSQAGVNLFGICGASGEILFASGNDIQEKKLLLIPEFKDPKLLTDQALLAPGDNAVHSGIFPISGELALVVSRPILTAAQKGPSRGTVFAGRFLSHAPTQKIRGLIQLPVHFFRLDDPGLPADFRSAETSLRDQSASFITSLDPSLTAGYSLLMGLNHRPIAILRVDAPGSTLTPLQRATQYVIWGLILCSSVCCFLLILRMRQSLVSGVARISTQLEEIGHHWISSARLQAEEEDGLDGLVNSMNSMLDNQEKASGGLVRSQELYRTLFDQSPSISLLIDPESRKVNEANPAALKFFRYSLDNIRNCSLSDLFVSTGKSDGNLILSEGTASNYPIQCEARLSFGEICLVETYANPLEVCGKKMILVTLYDVSEQGHAQQEISHLQGFYRSILDSLPADLTVYDLEGCILYLNPAAMPDEEVRGWMIGKTDLDYCKLCKIDPSFIEKRNEYRNLCTRQRCMVLFEEQINTLDGHLRHFLRFFSPVIEPGGAIRQVIGYGFDLTDRKKAENLLRDSEERYRLLFTHTNEGIALFGVDLKLLLFNERLSGMLGYTREELNQLTVEQVVYPPDFPRIQSNHKRRMRGDTVPRTYEFRVICKDGSILDVEGSFDSIFRGSEIIGIQGIIRDLTERKRIQEHIFEKQKEQSIVTLAGGIAHDFNNILVGIMGSAALLQEDLPDQTAHSNLINNILTSAGRMADLTNQLLAYARGGKHRPEPANPNQFVTDTLRMVHGSMRPNIQVNCQLDEEIWSVDADRTQITQVLLNIFVNACESMEKGGSLTIKTEKVHQSEEWYGATPEPLKEGEYVCISVTDTGSGMSEDTRRRLFEPFFTTKFLGRGLGLAAAIGIIRNHNGALDVQSELNKGSTFKVYLPRGKSLPIQSSTPPAPSSRKTGTVLVVDDEETVRDVAHQMLQRLGFTVMEAGDGQEAISSFELSHQEIVLVVLDMQMPGRGGVEVFGDLVALDPQVKIIISSGYEESAATASIAASPNLVGFIKKPYTFANLENTINRALLDQPDTLNPS